LAPCIGRCKPPDDKEEDAVRNCDEREDNAYPTEALGCNGIESDRAVDDRARSGDRERRENREGRDRPATLGDSALCSVNNRSLTQLATSIYQGGSTHDVGTFEAFR
jgi:hypothetical protein